MSHTGKHWSICPVEDCAYAVEYDADENLFCPSCEMELISECPGCKHMIETEDETPCRKCGESLKE